MLSNIKHASFIAHKTQAKFHNIVILHGQHSNEINIQLLFKINFKHDVCTLIKFKYKPDKQIKGNKQNRQIKRTNKNLMKYQTPGSGRTHQHEIIDARGLPVSDLDRSPTDVCCAIVGLVFGLVMFVVGLVAYDHGKLERINYPADRKGKICKTQTDQNKISYPFVYFNDINDPLSTRYCVKTCPQQGMKPQCLQKSCPLVFYNNYPSVNSLGEFCLPEGQVERNKLLYKANLYERWNSQRAIDFLLWGVLISTGLSFILMLLALFLPKFIIWVVTAFAIALLGLTAVIFFLNNNTTLQKGSAWAIFVGVLCIIFILVFLFYLVLHRERIQIAGAFLQVTSRYIKNNFLLFIYIPIYIGLTFLFGILTVFEYLAFSCFGNEQFSPDSIFYRLPMQGFWTFLLVIQTIWGLSFFRDSFNYIISSTAAQQFFNQKGKKAECAQYQKKCLRFNFGSVVGGSFINAFFYFPALIVNLLCSRVNFFCCNLFDLVRTDAYSYIGLTGNSYCPSVRQTQYLCYRSHVCRQNQSTNSVFSLAARIFISLASILIVYWISRDNLVEQKIPPFLLLGMFFVGLYISCYFLDILINSCEGLLTAFLTQIQLDQIGYKDMRLRNQNMNLLKEAIHQIQNVQGRYVKK